MRFPFATHAWRFCAVLFVTVASFSSIAEERAVTLQTRTGTLHGTLLLPDVPRPVTAALIIAGSGPTDRDGNQPSLNNNSLKLLAEGLRQRGIASLRFDKRGIAESRMTGLKEEQLRIETYFKDAQRWVKFLTETPGISNVVVIGHSEGALVGIFSTLFNRVAGLVVIASPGVRASKLLRTQIQASGLPGRLRGTSNQIIESLVAGREVKKVPPELMSLLRPSVQPYLMSWFFFDPVKELAALNIPVLVVQGTHDLQIDITHALKLKRAGPHVTVAWIADMNHVLKAAPRERKVNFATYDQPQLPLAEGLVDTIVSFIHQHER